VRNEIIKEYKYRMLLKNDLPSTPDILFSLNDKLNLNDVSPEVITSGLKYLQEIRDFYARLYKQVFNRKNKLRASEDKEFIASLKRNHHNESLEEFVTNKNEFKRIVEYKGELIQKTDPIYLDPMQKFVKAHFYAPRKQLFGRYISTIWVNVIVIWFMSVLLFIALYFRLLKRVLDYFENLEFGKKG
jgi:ABC transport system ATP-binding/permease protein